MNLKNLVQDTWRKPKAHANNDIVTLFTAFVCGTILVRICENLFKLRNFIQFLIRSSM
jgi:hypothetical protein